MQIGDGFKSVFFLLCTMLAPAIVAAPKMVDRVAAVVNNDVILESSVADMTRTVKNNAPPGELPDDKTLRSQVIDRLITEALILQRNEVLNLTVTDSDVSNAISQIAKQNGLTVNEMADHLAKTGVSFNEYRRRIQREILIEETRMNELRRRITITPQEVDILAKSIANKSSQNFEVNVSHILIAIPESPTPLQLSEAKKRVNLIMQKLKSGENFSRLAAAYSNDDLALSGGNLGWKKPNELPSLFEQKLIRSHKNNIIGPLQSGVGFHILKVNDVRRESKKPVTVLEVNARHILIKTNLIQDDKQVKSKLEKIKKDIQTHQIAFDQAAKRFSEDPGSKNRGGELGWNLPDRYDDAFRTALLKLKKGEISPPIKSSFGWHLIQLIDTRKVDRTDLALKDQAYRLIFNRKFSEESQTWIQELRADAYINIMENNG